MKNKIVVMSLMHGRHETVNKALNKLPYCLDVVMVYTTEEDGEFLEGRVKHKVQAVNRPFWRKWHAGIQYIRNTDYDAVIILGSDDYVDDNFITFIDKHINKYDFIGFLDMYYSKDNDLYYWDGYKTDRKGEPIGAGRVYSRRILEKMSYDLYYGNSRDRGMDGYSWKRLNKHNPKMLITTLKENNLFCCDIKDEGGMTKLESLKLEKV